jgi:hypothetical protein
MNPSVQAQIRVITSSAEVAMLQWTCRLRVALERSGFKAVDLENASIPECLTEAEFDAPNGVFPSEFRWEALQSCYRDRDSDTAGKVTPDGRVDFDVLWLSPTVFICSLSFERLVNEYLSNDCTFELFLREGEAEKIYQFAVYSLSSLLPGELDEPSLLPFQFLQHVTALLPANYFDEIRIYRSDRDRCPIGHLLQFLAIVPNGCATTTDGGTRFAFEGVGCTFSEDELQAVFSHPFHPSVKLGFGYHLFDESVPMIEMLKQATHLRSIEIPEQLFGPLVHQIYHEGPYVDLSVRSSNLTMRGISYLNGDHLTPSLLDTIATIHDVDDICVRTTVSGTAAQQRVLEYCICPFVDGSLKSRSLRIHLLGDEHVRLHKDEVKAWAAALSVSCKSKELRMFNVCFCPSANQPPQKLDKVKLWDAEIFPSLVLNYCGEKLMRPLEGKILSAAIKSVNQGLIYRKTTRHDPFDMRIANAGLIYALLRIKAGETQGAGDWHDVFSRLDQDSSSSLCEESTLSGRKRPVQSLQE